MICNSYKSAVYMNGLIYMRRQELVLLEGILFVLTQHQAHGAPGSLAYKKDSMFTFALSGSFYAVGVKGRASSVERYDVAADTWTAMADSALFVRIEFGSVSIGSAGSAEERLTPL
jgi:hypothetical protein